MRTEDRRDRAPSTTCGDATERSPSTPSCSSDFSSSSPSDLPPWSEALEANDEGAPSSAEVLESLSEWRGQRVGVALSGGIDSAVAALLLREAGALPIGLALRLHDPDPHNPMAPRACCPPEDLQDARRVAEALDIPFYVVDARDAFDTRVVKPFVSSYLSGRTPNPCVACNSFVKLDTLHRRARGLGCRALATGHYARLVREPLVHDRLGSGQGSDLASSPELAPRLGLYAAADDKKDQSYFLFGVPSEILSDLVFPVGGMTKDEVRRRAIASGLPVAHKLESQEVCFVGGSGAGDFVMRQPEAQGDHRGQIRSETGEILGEHAGVMNFTIGQRRGIGVSSSGPLFVLGLDPEARTVTVGPKGSLRKSGLLASEASWPSGRPSGSFRALARIRYRDRGTEATVSVLDDRKVRVDFDGQASAIAKGQAVVFYRGPRVLGGAWIEQALP